MTKKRIMAIMTLMMIVITVFAISMYANRETLQKFTGAYYKPLKAAVYDREALQGISEDFTVDKSFSTHMPLVIIDTGGVDPVINTEKKLSPDNRWIFEDIEGLDPYIGGSISVISGNERNHIYDKPDNTSNMLIKRRGNSSMLYEKAQYLIKLTTDTGEENKVSILNMGAESEWILNGSMADKSMIRNYLAYRTAAQFIPYTPDFEMCEVVFRNGSDYKYGGVYLIGENIKQGKNRVEIEKYKSTSETNSFLIRRDRYDSNGINLDTYATKNKLSKAYVGKDDKGITYLGMIYPSEKNIKPEMVEYVTDQISVIEKVIYSNDFDIYSTYSRYIDVDSFVDYFLFNEFFGSYDSGTYSTYMYRDVGGKLKMGPVWDYDGTMDNYILEPLKVDVMAFQIKPWFDRLVLDKSFVEKLQKRYYNLRKTVFSDMYMNNSIDEILAYIGPAQEREWTRWANVYTTDNKYSAKSYFDGDSYVYRNSLEFPGEIYNIKTKLRQHGGAIQESLNILEGSCIWQTELSSRMDIALLLALLIVVVSVSYIKRI